MTYPNIVLNWPSIIVATLAAFFFGGLWYGPLFGRTWGKLMGMKMDKKPDAGVMRRAFALQFIGLFLTAFVMTHGLDVWRPSTWGAGADKANYIYGFFSGFFTWLGFYLPMQLSKVAWESRPWKLVAINMGHDFLTLQIICQILAYWR